MRSTFSWLLVGALALSFAACNKNKGPHIDQAAVAAESAARHLGPEEHRASEFLHELATILEENMADGNRAEDRVEAYLSVHRDALIENTRRLEAILASKSGEERVVYEEAFSDYLAPAVQRWAKAVNAFSEVHVRAYRGIERQLKAFMNRNTAPL